MTEKRHIFGCCQALPTSPQKPRRLSGADVLSALPTPARRSAGGVREVRCVVRTVSLKKNMCLPIQLERCPDLQYPFCGYEKEIDGNATFDEMNKFLQHLLLSNSPHALNYTLFFHLFQYKHVSKLLLQPS